MATDGGHSNSRKDTARRSPHQVKLAVWAAQPVRAANGRAIAGTWLAMLMFVFVSQADPGQSAFIRSVAMIAIAGHGVLHVWLTNWLARESAAGLPEAKVALAAYRNPRRVSHIDLAMAWIALTAAVSLFRGI